MSVLEQPASAPSPNPSTSRFLNVAELLHGLGDIPPARVLMNPLPGTATEADLLSKVEVEDCLCELIDGTLVEKPVGFREAVLALAIGRALDVFVIARQLGVVSGPDSTLRVRQGTVRVPDVVFISYARLPGGAVPPEPIPSLSPDLAVEVLSRSNTKAEMSRKRREYFSGGTRLVWEFDADARTVAVYTAADEPSKVLSENDVLDGGEVLPGFTIALRELFARLDAKPGT